MNGDIYVTRNLRGKYVVRVEGQHARQADAIEAARRVAVVLGVELTIRGRHGRIRAKDSHGGDPPQIHG